MLKQQIMILYHDSKIQGNLIGVRSDPLKNTWSIECFACWVILHAFLMSMDFFFFLN